MKKILMLLIMASFVLSACALFPSNDSGRITGEIIEIFPSDNDVVIEISENGDIEGKTEEEVMEDKDEEVMDEYSNILVRIEGTEGDMISLKPDAFDPDGDTIIYTFTEPFDENGEWRTVEGDEGKYVVTVTVSDGRLSTSEDVLVILNPTNKAPIITCEDELTYEEGDLVEIKCDVRDPEGQDFTVEYSGWMETTEYQTTFEDSGSYEVVVSASDGDRTTTKTIDIIVENVNRVPKILSVTAEGDSDE